MRLYNYTIQDCYKTTRTIEFRHCHHPDHHSSAHRGRLRAKVSSRAPRKPEPVALRPGSNIINTGPVCDDPLQLEDDVLINQHLDDWDSLMRELGLHDDSTPFPQTHSDHQTTTHQITQTDHIQLSPTSPRYSNNWNVGFDYVDELIRLAECFETTQSNSDTSYWHGSINASDLPPESPSSELLSILRKLFSPYSPGQLGQLGRVLRRSFKPSSPETFSSISPIPMFSSFTANQAVLEAMEGSMHVHVIDFDIGLGGHWASFMKDVADKADSHKSAPAVLRISAIVPEEYGLESGLIRENLTQFARELNIRFDIEFILIRSFEYLSFKAMKFRDGEKVAVLLSPAIFRHVGTGFLNDLRRISPHVVVHVDIEGQMGFGTSSYRQIVIDGLEFYPRSGISGSC
ncbi:hypothetical protein BUALT_BualtUnG0053400 [Buddleja alternifolia]|uniref:Scarecrow-like protein 15 n=1 Tax=Buddleja alternifolia TaxID=168488 RepID=A0AAV6W3F9_9LAMI|nr:hypothetical protein BUALT_BualtUnG0053400 [Buddleja alternifolia]